MWSYYLLTGLCFPEEYIDPGKNKWEKREDEKYREKCARWSLHLAGLFCLKHISFFSFDAHQEKAEFLLCSAVLDRSRSWFIFVENFYPSEKKSLPRNRSQPKSLAWHFEKKVGHERTNTWWSFSRIFCLIYLSCCQRKKFCKKNWIDRLYEQFQEFLKFSPKTFL